MIYEELHDAMLDRISALSIRAENRFGIPASDQQFLHTLLSDAVQGIWNRRAYDPTQLPMPNNPIAQLHIVECFHPMIVFLGQAIRSAESTILARERTQRMRRATNIDDTTPATAAEIAAEIEDAIDIAQEAINGIWNGPPDTDETF